MASPFVKSNRMKRTESKKSHSWWWDSHISPKNSKWLQENLEEMDQHVKRVLKLIEEDADSFAKKAELYFKKRPELISLVEEFYRMYRSLAERYDHVTGELRKNIPSDLQSQGSGISDAGSEPPYTIPSPDRKPSRTKSGPRPAGFDYFLGSGLELNNKEGDESSTLDSESESRDDDDDDDSSVNNYSASQSNGKDEHRRIIELENELREVKQKLNTQREEISEGCEKSHYDNCEFRVKVAECEEEITRLTVELQKYRSSEHSNNVQKNISRSVAEEGSALEEELRVACEKLRESEEEVVSLRHEITKKGSEVQNLQEQLKSNQKEVPSWKNKLEREKREVSKLLDRIGRYKTNLSGRDQEIRGLKEAISNANKSLSEENEQLKAEMNRLTKERAYLEDNIKEMDLRCQSLQVAKAEMEAALGAQIEQLKDDVTERDNHVLELNERLVAIRDDLNAKIADLNAKIADLNAELNSKDKRLAEMSKHLHELHMNHVELIGEAEGVRKLAEELRTRVKELETEVERKQETILEGAEEKREAIRQLCISLEFYRNGYHELRQAVSSYKRPAVKAT